MVTYAGVFTPPHIGPLLSVVLDVPDAFRPVAWYGMRMALMPFRVQPVLIHASDAGADDVGIWYSCSGDGAVGASGPSGLAGPSGARGRSGKNAPPNWFRIAAPPHTVATFLERRPLRAAYIRFDDDIPVLFPCAGDVTNDPIAGSAYLLGLWHETMTTARDEHGRMRDADTLVAQLGAAERPVADVIRLAFGMELERHGLALERRTFGAASWAFCATHDIDYDRKWRKGIFYREIMERGLLGRGRLAHLFGAARGAGLAVSGRDPFRRATARMREEVEARGGRSTYFFKAGAHGFRDVAYSLTTSFMRAQMRALIEGGFGIGLHPSYFAWDRLDWMHEEHERLQKASGQPIDSVRMHYLRWSHPDTPRLLAREGFRVDSTVGFSASAGFRAGTCMPFALFDTNAMQELELWEVPLIAMESAIFNRLGASGAVAVDLTRSLMQTCEELGGVFTGLWHNTLWDEAEYPGWGHHFTWTLDRARSHAAAMLRVDEIPGAWS